MKSGEIAAGTFLIAAGNVISAGLSILFFIAIARSLTVSDYGSVRYQLGVAGLVNTIVVSGICTATMRGVGQAAGSRERQSRYFVNGILAALLTLPALALFSYVLGGFRILVVVVVVAGTVVLLYSALQMGLVDPSRLSIFVVFTGALRIVPLIPLMFLNIDADPNLILLIYSLFPLLAIPAIELLRRSAIDVRTGMFHRETLREIWLLSAPIITASIASVVLSGADILVVQFYLGSEKVGIYSAMKTLPSLFMFLPQAYIAILVPIAAREISLSRTIRVFRTPLYVTCGLAVPFLLVLSLFGEEVMKLLYPSSYFASTEILLYLGLSTVFSGVNWLLTGVFLAIGKPVVNAVTAALGAGGYVGIAVVTVPKLELVGASVSLVAGYGIILVSLLVFLLMWQGPSKESKTPSQSIH